MSIDDAIGLDAISDQTDLEFTLRVDAFDEAVGASSGWGTARDGLSLATERTVETAGLSWTVDAYGGSEYTRAVGLFDQRPIWVGGVLLTLIAVMIARP